MTYFFLLGRTPELSLRELQAVLGFENVRQLAPQIAETDLEDDAAAQKLFAQLGGSLKVLKKEGEFLSLTHEDLHKYVVAYLAQFPKPHFAIAEIGRENIPQIVIEDLKKDLKKRDISSRFIEGPKEGLSAAILLHHKNVIELNVIKVGEQTFFARTISVQDIDNWTIRDREKPYADRKKGMLPPKLARIMVNLAIGQDQTPKTLYDPFCGSGTVLIEAAMLGECVKKTFGSDLDKNAVQGTKTNMEWLAQRYMLPLNFHIFMTDASQVTPEHTHEPIDLIVTEPFLGKPTPLPTQLPNIFKGLEKMYLGVFKQWTKILQKHAKVVMIFPYVEAGNPQHPQVFSLEGMIDKLRALGYTPDSEPVMYARPQAIIQRQIWVFTFDKK